MNNTNTNTANTANTAYAAYVATAAREMADIIFREDNESLQKIVLGLSNYVETQRGTFPSAVDVVEAALKIVEAEREASAN